MRNDDMENAIYCVECCERIPSRKDVFIHIETNAFLCADCFKKELLSMPLTELAEMAGYTVLTAEQVMRW